MDIPSAKGYDLFASIIVIYGTSQQRIIQTLEYFLSIRNHRGENLSLEKC